MKAIIISGMPASGKSTVARILGKKLGLEHVDGGNILKELAKENGYHPEGKDWWDTEEGKSFVKEREKDQNFDKETDRRMLERTKKGNVVVTSYTMPWLANDCFKVWLDTSDLKRAERMASRDHTDLEETKRTLEFRTKENIKQYEALYHYKFGSDKKVFNLIIDTDEISPEETAEIIINKIKEMKM